MQSTAFAVRSIKRKSEFKSLPRSIQVKMQHQRTIESTENRQDTYKVLR